MEKQSSLLTKIKRQAKSLRKERNLTHSEALDILAKENGFSNWKHCLKESSSQVPAPVEEIKTFPELSFTNWLKRQERRDSPLGDLARDVARDNSWPEHDFLDQYYSYLLYKGASPSALHALKKAWTSYFSFLRRKGMVTPRNPIIYLEVEVKDKQKYLDENSPFGGFEITQKKKCLHCGQIINVGGFKVFRIDWEELIYCPNAPSCDGTIIDWIDVM